MQSIQHQVCSRESLTPNLHTSTKIDVLSVVTWLIFRAFYAWPKIPVQGLPHVWSFHKPLLPKNQQKQVPHKSRKPKAHQLKAGALYAQENAISNQSEDSFSLQIKIQHTQASIKNGPTLAYLIANLAYQLKSHQRGNLYLRPRLDTCRDVNIMSASIYRLMFKDPEMKKVVPSELEIGTYTTDTVKIVGSCRFYCVHPDRKK